MPPKKRPRAKGFVVRRSHRFTSSTVILASLIGLALHVVKAQDSSGARALPALLTEAFTVTLPDPLPGESWIKAALAVTAPPVQPSPMTDDAAPRGKARDALVRARLLARRGEAEAAERLLVDLSERAPDAATRGGANALLGEMLLRRGEGRPAAMRFSSAEEELSPDKAWRLRFWLAAALIQAGESEAAADTLRSAARLAGAGSPERRLAYHWSGWLEADQGRSAAARAAWSRALRESPPPAERDSLRLSISESWFSESRYDSALWILESDPAPVADLVRWDFLRGRAYFAQGEIGSAAAPLERVLRTESASEDWKSTAHSILGWIAFSQGCWNDAYDHYSGVGDRGGESYEARYAMAVARLRGGRIAEADSILSRSPLIAADDPLSGRWMYALARTQYLTGRFTAARATLENADFSTGDESLRRAVWVLRGDAAYQLGRMEDAYSDYSHAAAEPPPAAESLLRRQALAAFGTGRWGSAARLFGDLTLRYPATGRGGEYHFWRGEAFARLGRVDDARRHYSQAERLGADPIQSAYSLAMCDLRQERFADALEHLERARRHCGECPLAADIATRTGDCLTALGRIEEAAEAYGDATGRRIAGGTAYDREVVFERALLDLEQGDWASAQRTLAGIHAAEGETGLGARALYWEGEAALRQREYSRAVSLLEEYDDHPAATDSLRFEARLAIAGALSDVGEKEEAARWYRKASATENVDAVRKQAAHRSLADLLLALSDYSGALQQSQAERDLYRAGDPRRCDALERIARNLEALGRAQEAAAEYESLSATSSCANQDDAMYHAGRLRLALGDASRALTLLQRRLSRSVDPAEAARTRALMAQAYGALDQTLAAQNEWEKVAHAGAGVPDSLRAAAYLRLAERAFADGAWQAARALYAAADSLGRALRDQRAAYWAGESAARMNDYDGAAAWFERYLEAGESDPVWEANARYALGGVYERLGRFPEARAQYERILAVPLPESRLPEKARARLGALDARTAP